MKLETFFNKFDLFANAPDAVAKMRELVLDLAVKGKLTDRDAKKESVASKYSDEPSSDVLPPNWRLLNFGKFCDIQGGNQPPKSQFSDEPRPGYVRMFQIRDLGERPVPVYISKKSTNRFCREGEILIGRYGASVGKVFWAQDGAYNVALAKFIFPEDALLPAFAFWVLKSDFFQAEIAGASRSAQAGFNKGDLAAIDFPLPPRAEQKRIVAKVDELMALCDRLAMQQQERETRHAALARASLARFAEAPTPANLDFLFHKSYTIPPAELRKSILTLAVQGKLVPQDPNDEPAVSLLAKITRQKQAMIEAKQVRQGKVSRPHSALEAPAQLPPGWEWVNVDSLCFKVTDGTHFTPQYASSGVRFVSAKDIVSGKLIFDRCKFITREEHEQLYRRCNPEYHDIVISKSGSIGTVALVEDRDEFSLFESLALLKFDKATLFPDFLVYALTHACASLTAGHIRGVGVKHLHLDILRGLEMALPPLAEQRRIVAKVNQLMALVDELETQLAASRATAATLLDALVAELTAQNESSSTPRSEVALPAPNGTRADMPARRLSRSR